MNSDEWLEAKELEEKGFNQALKYLTYRPRTVSEVKNHLKKKGYSSRVINLVVEKLSEINYLNDYQYAVDWLNYQISNSKDGPKLLEYKLKQKGISQDIVKHAIHEIIDEDKELNLARKAFKKKYNSEISTLTYEEKQKVGAYLQRKGFSYEIIVNILDF
ncbi:regulatory protein RecX [Natranaerofaba carboxydovora]|uniref:regulatory protein RecX n=1 Tax=Natranaerofaba carboxydovora TaxID=2742683 RepID=UPI001F12CC5C|nr:regulatory protein RecX [Natranaerofaba carboxydovora]UMZ73478.1 Regulatory protein RecX [Natranaerofaba carboxydovora]